MIKYDKEAEEARGKGAERDCGLARPDNSRDQQD